MTLYSFIGIAVTSASTVVFGQPVWNPVTLLGKFHQPWIAFLGMVGSADCDAQCEYRGECGLAFE
jgi:NCS1 family nucleobase:cation symporter-1